VTRVLVLGAGGMLGHKVLQRLSAGHQVIATLRGSRAADPYRRIPFLQTDAVVDGVDAADFDALTGLLDRVRPEAVVNCVGVIKQRAAAASPVPSITVNSLLPHVLADRCEARGARLIHFSTDCVFNGRRGGYTEDDVSDAEDLYGRTKYLGEVAGRPGAVTLRTSIVGRELTHFQSLIEWFLAQEGGKVGGYRRARYSGVTTGVMAGIVERLVNEHPGLSGLYQVAGPWIDKFALLHLVRDAFGVDVEIVPDDRIVVDRTMYGDRFREATGITVPSWEEMIGDMAGDPTPYEEWR
jgi:dTDP-4-dehydrorhamnose reductase